MNGRTRKIRQMARVLSLALAIAAVAVPAAHASDGLVDDYFRDSTGVTAGPAVTYGPRDRLVDDWFRDPQAVTPLATAPVSDRLVDDWFRDTNTATASQPTSNSFDWSVFLIGAGSMLGFVLIASGLALGAVSLRHRSGTLSTS